jgi:hypothetical protein
MMANTSDTSPMIESAEPIGSRLARCRPGVGDDRHDRDHRKATMGTVMKKTEPHQKCSSSTPTTAR